MEFEIAGRFAA